MNKCSIEAVAMTYDTGTAFHTVIDQLIGHVNFETIPLNVVISCGRNTQRIQNTFLALIKGPGKWPSARTALKIVLENENHARKV
jgi:hypothetical protein